MFKIKKHIKLQQTNSLQRAFIAKMCEILQTTFLMRLRQTLLSVLQINLEQH